MDDAINRYNGDESQLISILLGIQEHYRYLPKDALEYLSRKMNIPLNSIYHIATFFKAFSLEPKGKHVIKICLGTACHVRGGAQIWDKLKYDLGLDESKTTTDDMLFTVERVNCLGVCALAPVVVVDDNVMGEMTMAKMDSTLRRIKKREGV